MYSGSWVWYRDADDAHARDDNARFRAVLGHFPKCIAVLDESGNHLSPRFRPERNASKDV